MKKKVFLSHRRDLGQATTEALLIKEEISHNSTAKIFMDVTEDFETILNITIETLNNDPRILSIPDVEIPLFKTKLKSKLWPL